MIKSYCYLPVIVNVTNQVVVSPKSSNLYELITATKYVVALQLTKSFSWINHLMVNSTKHFSRVESARMP